MDVSFWIYGYYILDILNRLNDGLNETTVTQTDSHPPQHTPDQHTNNINKW